MNNQNTRNGNDYDREKPIEFHEYVTKFLRRKKLFLCISIPIFICIILYQFLKPYTPIYRALFDIGVSQERPVEGFFSGYQPTPTIQIGTVSQRVIANLMSISLAEKVVDTLGLYAYIKNANPDVIVQIGIKQKLDEEIGPLRLLIRPDKFKIYNNGDKIAEGPLDKIVDIDHYTIHIISINKVTDTTIHEVTIYPRTKMALALRNSISIKVLDAEKIEQEVGSSGIPFSGEGLSEKIVTANPKVFDTNIGILRISVHWGNPEDALKIAEVLSKQVIEEDIGEKSLQFIQSQTFIDSQLTVYQDRLTRFEEDIRIFKESKNIADLKASTQALISQISQLESRKNQIQIEQEIIKDLGDFLATNEEEIDIIPNFASVLISDPVLNNFYSQLLNTEAELKGRLKEYSTEHPKVLEVKAKLAGLKDQMKVEITKRTSTVKAEIASVDNKIVSLQARLENVPDDEIQLARIERDKETAEKLYTFFAEKLEETRVQEAGITSDLRIINPPLISPETVNSKGIFKSIIVAFFISFFVGGLAIFIVEYLDNTVKDPEIITTKIGLPIFATIPIMGNENVKNKQLFQLLSRIGIVRQQEKERGSGSGNKTKIINNDVTSAEFEAFRKLVINLDFAHPEKKYRIIYITSPGPEEGKTHVSLNLGTVLALIGKRVILVDTDFRKKKGHLSDLVKLRQKFGLFNVLKGQKKLDSVITSFDLSGDMGEGKSDFKTQLRDLTIVPIGDIPPNPFVFLESNKMREIIKELSTKFDYVIVDGVPVLLFADASYLASFTDGVLMAVRYGKTGLKELENSRDILYTAKSDIIGIAMNAMPRTKGSYYYHYYHKYYSKYYKN